MWFLVTCIVCGIKDSAVSHKASELISLFKAASSGQLLSTQGYSLTARTEKQNNNKKNLLRWKLTDNLIFYVYFFSSQCLSITSFIPLGSNLGLSALVIPHNTRVKKKIEAVPASSGLQDAHCSQGAVWFNHNAVTVIAHEKYTIKK